MDDTLFTSRTGAIYLWFYDNLGVEQQSLLPGLRDAMLACLTAIPIGHIPCCPC